MNLEKIKASVRRRSRPIHRHLAFFFTGVIIIYAISGFMLNHKRDFNPNYTVKRQKVEIAGTFPANPNEFTEQHVKGLLELFGESDNYMKHYFPAKGELKVFIREGSSLTVDINTGKGVYESLKKRPVISAFNRLHRNPTRWWTLFSDIFIASLLIITITGLILTGGRKGLWGRGGMELLAGILIPLMFMLFI